MNQIISMFPEQFEERMQEARKWERERIVQILEVIAADWRKADLHQEADLFTYAVAIIKSRQK